MSFRRCCAASIASSSISHSPEPRAGNRELNSSSQPLFPAFERFVERNESARQCQRVSWLHDCQEFLARGKHGRMAWICPPRSIERQQELIALSLPTTVRLIAMWSARSQKLDAFVDAHAKRMRDPENRRRFALQVLQTLEGVSTGNKDNQFFAGRLVLVADKGGQNWAWSMTAHYPVIAKIPADVDYVVSALQSSRPNRR